MAILTVTLLIRFLGQGRIIRAGAIIDPLGWHQVIIVSSFPFGFLQLRHLHVMSHFQCYVLIFKKKKKGLSKNILQFQSVGYLQVSELYEHVEQQC
jgi:hypothetical protein